MFSLETPSCQLTVSSHWPHQAEASIMAAKRSDLWDRTTSTSMELVLTQFICDVTTTVSHFFVIFIFPGGVERLNYTTEYSLQGRFVSLPPAPAFISSVSIQTPTKHSPFFDHFLPTMVMQLGYFWLD